MKKLIVLLFSISLIFPYHVYAEEIESNDLEKNEEEVSEVEVPKTEIVTLDSCVDGDTAKFKNAAGELYTARFLAVDTPETVHPTKGVEPFGKDASNYICSTLTNAKEIKIEYDLKSDEEDNYGRKLVWVFVDNKLLQESLVAQGYAEVAYLYDDYKYTSLLQDTETLAKLEKKGIWSIDEENIVEEKEERSKEKEDTNKSFIDYIIDSLLGKISKFINDILDSIVRKIENML